MITFLGQETLSTHISWPRNVIMSHFLAKKRYQPVGSVITFLRREIVTPITDITLRDMVCFQHTPMRDVLIVFVVHGTHLLRRTPSKVKEKNLPLLPTCLL